MKKPKGWMKLKSYRLGFKAAKKGQPMASCPYKLDDETRKLMVKRQRWLMGWEEARYRPGQKRNAVISITDLEKIAAICPEPKKTSKLYEHMKGKKQPKKNSLKLSKKRKSKLYET